MKHVNSREGTYEARKLQVKNEVGSNNC